MVERPSTQPPEAMEVDPPDDALNMFDDEEGGTRIGDIYIPPPVKPHCSTESKGPRLIITQIYNENFKSYAGKVILGPFHHRFSSIIGPNGSGKSNVIDALLFVFGYRAQKIRSKNLQVLMHKSSRYPNTKKCTVAVHFEQILDREDGSVEVIPNSEIVVSRTITSDNLSQYTINDRRVQFKEVSRLLKTHGVDLDHNRFLILQGEVESIAMMKAKGQTENECGMLEYLEDIVGTTRYKEPLAKISERVETLTDERTEKHNRCKLAEREMKDLEQPYNEAIDHLKLENNLTKTKNLKIQKYLSEQRKKLHDFAEEREGIDKDLKAHDEHFNNLKKERLEKEATIKEEIQQYEKLCKEKDDMENKFKTALNNFTESQTTMTATNKRRKANKTQLIKIEEKLEEFKRIPEKNQKEIIECEQTVEKVIKQKATAEETLQANYAEIEKETAPLISQREELETQLLDLKKNVDESNAALSLAKSELEILKSDETTQKRKYESLKSSFDDTTTNLKEQMSNVEELKTAIPEIKNEIQHKIKELHLNKTEEESLRRKVLAMRADIQERVSSMQTAKSNNSVLNALMRQKQEGNIPGILGRLGDLGGIDSKYDVAISTVCGRLDNIVVDTVNTAQACIEHLKKYDIGRASFIALEKVQHLRRKMDAIRTPENIPRLFDLVRVEDERVLPAFYFALRDTLVADELDQGTRIAYTPPRWRVVTLRGDVIETSGTMSGGGRSQIRGKMGQQVTTKTADTANTSLVSQKALQKLQEEAEEMQSRVNYLQELQGNLERDITQLKASLQRKESELNRLAISVSSLQQQLPVLESQMKKQEILAAKTVADPEKVKKLEIEIEAKQKKYNKSEKAASSITNKISDINSKINNVHSNKIKSVQKKIDDHQKQITKLNAQISKLKVEITTSARNVTKTEKEIEDLQNEIHNAEETIKELNAKREQYDQEGVEWRQKIDDIKKEIENARSDSSQIQKEIINIQKQESEGKLKRVEIEQKLQTLDKKISEVKDHMPHWQNQLKPLKLHEIPGETEQEHLKTYTEEELNTYKLQDLQYQFSVIEEKFSKSTPNLSVIQEYTNKNEIYLERVQILEDITNKRNEMRQLYDDVRKKRYTEFMQGFHIITKKLKEMYQMITQGGDAELELVDSMDPFTEGVSFSVRPPKKTWKNISNLSGGEKTLSSLALVFALHYYKPSPLYFMDEIDAALDFKNISIVAHYIKERTKNAQFIIISLRSNMFELSDYLVGIYKVNDCTNSITIRNYIESTDTPEPPSSQDQPQSQSPSQAPLQKDNQLQSNDTFDMLRIAS